MQNKPINKEEEIKAGIKRFIDRLKVYMDRVKNADDDFEKNIATNSLIGYLEGFIEFYK